MAIAAYDDSAALGTFVPDAGVKQNSRIIGVFLMKKGFDVTQLSEDPADWTAHVTSGDVVIINAVTGSWPEASENTQPGIGRVQTEYVSMGFDISFRHKNVDDNFAFYNKLLKSKEYGAGFVFHDNVAYLPLSGTVGTDPDPDAFEVDIIDWFCRPGTDGEQLEGDRFMYVNGRWTSADLPYTMKVPESLFPL